MLLITKTLFVTVLVENYFGRGKVPDNGFKSGDVNIPGSYVEKSRDILNEMKNRTNVLLHFNGHSDSDKLGPDPRAKYREQETAEYFQRE